MRYALPFLFASFLWGQQTSTTPDNTQVQIFTSACTATGGTTITVPDTNPYVYFRLTFYVDGISATAASVGVQGAPDNGGVAGTFTTTGLTLVEGAANPIASAAQGTLVVKGFFKFIRILCNSVSGSLGTVTATLLSYKGTNPAAAASGGVASNVNVVQYATQNVASAGENGVFAMGGPEAAGVAPVANPNAIAGFDGTNNQRFRTDTSGQAVPSGVAAALANGRSNTPNEPQVGVAGTPGQETIPVYPFKFNGSTWDRDQNCATAKPVITNLSGSGNTTIFTGTAAQNIYLCDIEFSTGTPEDFKLTEGTTANCASGTADATALMKNISAWSLTPGGGTTAYLITQTAGDSLCANQANAQAAAVTVWAIKY